MTEEQKFVCKVAYGIAISNDKITKNIVCKVLKSVMKKGYTKFEKEVYILSQNFRKKRLARQERSSIMARAPLRNRLLALKERKFLNCVQEAKFETTKNHLDFVHWIPKDQKPRITTFIHKGQSEFRFFVHDDWTKILKNKDFSTIAKNCIILCAEKINSNKYSSIWVTQNSETKDLVLNNGFYFNKILVKNN